MAPHKIIADSDDEDDFTPGQSPVKPQTPATALDLHSPTAGNGTGSTDPGFFQAIYSEQQEAVATDCSIGPDKSFDLVDTTSSSISLHPNLQQKTGIENTSSLTSATDPASKRPMTTNTTDSNGLTQISTPGRKGASTMKDVWDIPSSPEAAGPSRPVRKLVSQAKTPKTTSTNKRGGSDVISPIRDALSPIRTHATDAIVNGHGADTPPRSTKRQRVEHDDIMSPTQENSFSRIIGAQGCPVSGQKPAGPSANVSRSSEHIDPTPEQGSLCIEPATLSTSQRALYQSLHPSPEEETGQDFDAAAHFRQAMSGMRSSGATTIAYATPSQWQKSSHPVAPEPKEVSSPATSRKKRARVSYTEPASSPDMLAAEEKPAKREKTAKVKLDAASTGRGRGANRQVMDSDEDENEDDEDGFTVEAYQPRPSWRRAIGARLRGVEGNAEEEQMAAIAAATHVADTQEPPRTLADAEPDSLPPRRKRGRPKKSEALLAPHKSEPVEKSLLGDAAGKRDTSEPQSGVMETVDTVRAAPEVVKPEKKKRGRPRKSDKAAAPKAAPVEVPVDAPAACIDDVTSGTKIDGPAAIGPPPDGLPEEDATTNMTDPHAEVDLGALGETTGNPIKAADKAANDNVVEGQQDKEKKDEAKAKEAAAKPAKRETSLPVTPQAGKPLYRVGLSKRSRIAPLLKSLRKT